MGKVNVCYKFEGLIINQGDIVEVIHKDPITDKETKYKGRVLLSVVSDKLKLDCSKAYESIIEEIELLKSINSLDIKKDRIDIKINRKYNTFSKWYSDNGYYINQDYFYIWLKEVKDILKLNKNIKIDTHILQYNNVKINNIKNEYNNLLDKIVSVLKI